MNRIKVLLLPTLAGILLSVAGCGGGGGGGGSPQPASTQSTPSLPVPHVIGTPESFANKCTVDDEKSWVRAHLDDVYLWYKEIVDVPSTAYASPSDYFYALLVRSHDRFSFTASQQEIDSYFQSGEEFGYGANFVTVGGSIKVAYTLPNTPAAQQNVVRGAEIVAINGVPIAQASQAALYPDAAGLTNRFSVIDAGTSSPRTVTLTSATVTRQPVYDSRVISTADGKKVGYLVFNEHIATAEAQLVSAMQNFKNTGIDDLVLDLRYNGGGYLYIASDLAAMIAGPSVTGKVFEKLRFNDKHPEKTADPVNTVTFPMLSSTGVFLPQLNLSRVFVLTGADTCSASESVINALSPFMQVIQIGGKTCGKPYGMIQTNNCGQAYFAIEFEGVNSLGLADYATGFTPTCSVGDDLDHQLGDISERLLKTAIDYRTSNSCPASQLTQARSGIFRPVPAATLSRPQWKANRVLKAGQPH